MSIRLYQKDWHGIIFSDLTKVSISSLPGSDFYSEYYRVFKERYPTLDLLSATWKGLKSQVASFLFERIRGGYKVLSYGSGIGYVESELLKAGMQRGKGVNLSMFDFAPSVYDSLCTLDLCNSVYIGDDLGVIPENDRFDLIYLSAVEYALSGKNLVKLLENLSNKLSVSGRIILISVSWKESITCKDRVKQLARYALHFTPAYSLGQFWGWIREKKEIIKSASDAGLDLVDSGVIDPDKSNQLWLEFKRGKVG